MTKPRESITHDLKPRGDGVGYDGSTKETQSLTSRSMIIEPR